LPVALSGPQNLRKYSAELPRQAGAGIAVGEGKTNFEKQIRKFVFITQEYLFSNFSSIYNLMYLKQNCIPAIFFALLIGSCGPNKSEGTGANTQDSSGANVETAEQNTGSSAQKQNPNDFIPNGFMLFETINGDLNNDGIEDCVLIIKGSDKTKVVTDEVRGQLDRNRRGLIVLFKKNDNYELAIKSEECFSSENEDGGVYFAPELGIEIKKSKLYISYFHGRYGYWAYVFRYQNSDFELIGYSSSDNHGPVVESETSINFSTKDKIVKENTNPDAEGGDEVFETTKTKISIDKLFKLSEIEDFDQIDLSMF